MTVYCFIPARLGSSRFPGKPLYKLNKKPMIQWIYEASVKSSVDEVFITTPDNEIIEFCKKNNYGFIKSSPTHERCLDRVYESYNKLKREKSTDDIIICMQGDEPLIIPSMINNIVSFHINKSCDFAVSGLRISEQEFNNPNIVKIAYDDNFKTIYTSRSPIPFSEQGHRESARIYGLFSLSPKGLTEFNNLKPSRLEILESCDTNRILGTQLSQYVCIHENITSQQSVDVMEDAIKAERLLRD